MGFMSDKLIFFVIHVPMVMLINLFDVNWLVFSLDFHKFFMSILNLRNDNLHDHLLSQFFLERFLPLVHLDPGLELFLFFLQLFTLEFSLLKLLLIKLFKLLFSLLFQFLFVFLFDLLNSLLFRLLYNLMLLVTFFLTFAFLLNLSDKILSFSRLGMIVTVIISVD